LPLFRVIVWKTAGFCGECTINVLGVLCGRTEFSLVYG
jgi:hypothetical protein